MARIQQPITATCYHCGDACNSKGIKSGDKVFCCNGCKTVFELLDETTMCEYYAMGNAPGIKQHGNKKFEFLDEERIQSSLLNFNEGGVSRVTLYIPAIHCSSCIWLLENLHKMNPGIIDSSIHFQSKTADIRFDDSISLRQIAELLSRLGYDPQITLNGKILNNKSVNKSLLYKLGVAGFCFGNIMLLSLSEYLSLASAPKDVVEIFFTYLNLLLALPVVFYSASDYFISAFKAIKNRVINIDLPIALGLGATFLQSAFEIISGSGAGYLDSLTGLVFFLLIGKWYQSKTYAALSFERDYKSYFPITATTLLQGVTTHVPLRELTTGTVVVVRNEEIIPADGIVVDGNAHINYSFVTGEVAPILKKKGSLVFAGGRQLGTNIKVQITRTVSESYFTQLWNKSEKKTSGLNDFTNKVGRYFTGSVLLIGLATYCFWYWKDTGMALRAAVSVFIIFCPCTLALAIPFCFGNAMNILGKNKFYLKNTDAVEKLADNDTIVFDKTGTLTQAEEAEIEFDGFLTLHELEYVKALVKNSIHPLSRMLSYFLGDTPLSPDAFKESLSEGIWGIFDKREVKVGSAVFVGVAPSRKAMSGNNSLVFVSINGMVKGCYAFRNKYRGGMEEMLTMLGRKYKLHLLSGDNAAEQPYLLDFFKKECMHFQRNPEDKLSYINALGKHNKTMMIGDGLNDAGALLQSNFGISVTEDVTHFSPACDAILEAASLCKLPDFIAYARACKKLVYMSLMLSLLYNVVGLTFAVQGLLQPLVAAILMPLSSVSVVLFVTIGSTLLARRYALMKN